jgi:hypothetical protein
MVRKALHEPLAAAFVQAATALAASSIDGIDDMFVEQISNVACLTSSVLAVRCNAPGSRYCRAGKGLPDHCRTAELPNCRTGRHGGERRRAEGSNDVMTIKGENEEEKEETKKDYHRTERRYGAFQRSSSLGY